MEVIDKPKIAIDANLLAKMKTETEEMGQVILHMLYKAPADSLMSIRIWPTSYLYDLTSSHRSELIHVENIAMFPNWFHCLPGEETFFTLIFSGLPKSCTKFEFKEECLNQAGAFGLDNIPRNESDVYYINIEG